MAPQGIGSTTVASRPKAGVHGGNASTSTDLLPWRPSATDPWDAAKAAHLLRRAGFGGTPDEIEAAVQLGMNRTVDLLLTVDRRGIQEFGAQVLPNGEVLYLNYSLVDQRAQWLYEAANGRFPLREKLALFWHDHFSVGAESGVSVPLLPVHINLFRRLGLGSFKTLLTAVTTDPAMLRWLDNYLNGRRGLINENYGRELLELYTMGVDGGYTQTDVTEASKCLSGWGLQGYNRSAWVNGYHVRGSKTVLGTVISNTDGRRDLSDLLDVILAWPKTAEFMAKKLFEYFVDFAPSPALLGQLANLLREVGYDIGSFLAVILRSNYFYKSAPRELVKNPMELMVGAIRNTGMTPVYLYRTLGALLERMGLPLLRYSTPAGLDDGMAWINSSSMIERANFTNNLTQVNPNAGVRARFDPLRELRRKGLRTDVEIVDHYLDILVDGQAPAAVRANLIRFMNTSDAGPDPWVLDAVHANRKVRGLVHLITSLPEYQIS